MREQRSRDRVGEQHEGGVEVGVQRQPSDQRVEGQTAGRRALDRPQEEEGGERHRAARRASSLEPPGRTGREIGSRPAGTRRPPRWSGRTGVAPAPRRPAPRRLRTRQRGCAGRTRRRRAPASRAAGGSRGSCSPGCPRRGRRASRARPRCRCTERLVEPEALGAERDEAERGCQGRRGDRHEHLGASRDALRRRFAHTVAGAAAAGTRSSCSARSSSASRPAAARRRRRSAGCPGRRRASARSRRRGPSAAGARAGPTAAFSIMP